jgi:hypothetical protein
MRWLSAGASAHLKVRSHYSQDCQEIVNRHLTRRKSANYGFRADLAFAVSQEKALFDRIADRPSLLREPDSQESSEQMRDHDLALTLSEKVAGILAICGRKVLCAPGELREIADASVLE